MAFLSVSDVSMAFPVKGRESFLALDAISLDVAKNEFVCLIGHSGCGKSTLLNLIGGLLMPTSGRIACEQKPIEGPGPDRAMVFQSHALLPWMTCYENVHLAVKQVFGRTPRRAELKDKAEQALTSFISITPCTNIRSRFRAA
jgi:nitrate/nitrite transport system ATP-binding protein